MLVLGAALIAEEGELPLPVGTAMPELTLRSGTFAVPPTPPNSDVVGTKGSWSFLDPSATGGTSLPSELQALCAYPPHGTDTFYLALVVSCLILQTKRGQLFLERTRQ